MFTNKLGAIYIYMCVYQCSIFKAFN